MQRLENPYFDIIKFDEVEKAFICKCSCGLVMKVKKALLNTKNKRHIKGCTSCSQKRKIKDLVGFIFGDNCEVLSFSKTYNRKSYWVCLCGRCNQKFETTKGSITRKNNIKTCLKCSRELVAKQNKYNKINFHVEESDNEISKYSNQQLRTSFKYKNLVKKSFIRDEFKCYCCSKRGGILNIHHLNGFNWCKSQRFDIANVVTLCKYCHNLFHEKFGRGNNTIVQFNNFHTLLYNG